MLGACATMLIARCGRIGNAIPQPKTKDEPKGVAGRGCVGQEF
jgi:hypothetical protein